MTRWSVPRPRVRGGAADQAGQGRRTKAILVGWASPRTPIRRRYAASSEGAGSRDRPSWLRAAGAERALQHAPRGRGDDPHVERHRAVRDVFQVVGELLRPRGLTRHAKL